MALMGTIEWDTWKSNADMIAVGLEQEPDMLVSLWAELPLTPSESARGRALSLDQH